MKVIDSPRDFVVSTFSLRLRKHNLEDYATSWQLALYYEMRYPAIEVPTASCKFHFYIFADVCQVFRSLSLDNRQLIAAPLKK